MTTTEERGLVEYQAPAPLTVFGTDDPAAIVTRVTAIAGPLADFIKRQHMSTQISGREYVLAEGWSFMGAMLGVAPVTRRVSEVRDPAGDLMGFEAHVELVSKDGSIVGGAIGECAWVEANWGGRDPFALKSMAQTRATGKAYRMAFGFVMKAAGYEATPAEEMGIDAVAGGVPASDTRRGGRTPRPPQARSNDPEWLEPMQEAMRERRVTFDDIGRFLETPATTLAITEWLQANPDLDVGHLVVEAANLIVA